MHLHVDRQHGAAQHAQHDLAVLDETQSDRVLVIAEKAFGAVDGVKGL